MGRRDWAGTPEEMLEALSEFSDDSDAPGWPSDSVSSGVVMDAEDLEDLEKLRASGVPEEMLEKLTAFPEVPDYGDAPGWPSGPASLAEALEELQPVLASIGLLIDHIDDSRLRITRPAAPPLARSSLMRTEPESFRHTPA